MSQIPSCLIIENQKGKIFIIDQGSPHQVEKILNNAIKTKESNDYVHEEEEEEEEVVVEEYLEDEDYNDYLQEIISEEEKDPVKINEEKYDHSYSYADAHSVESIDSFIIEEVCESEQPKTKLIKGSHKFNKLTGKAACKYCESLFSSKETLKKHFDVCKYLQCNKKNFICKTCGKELSRKTFSNHLHETLNCQFCQKEFLNPRNLKTHLLKMHKNDDFVPPSSPSLKYYKELQIIDDEFPPVVKEKKKYPRKVGRFECDLCGRILKTNRSLSQHLLLHSKSYQFVCENCGEKFTTKTGINKHACERKRRRPEKDFRTADVRHCKYCDLWFQTLEENKEHECVFQFQHDSKMFRCRFCQLEMAKNSYNKHMSKHTDPNEYLCSLCDKQLATEAALINHLTVHSGDKPFRCDKCDKSFINKSLLTRHSRFHGIEIPIYKCEVCNREVASKYHLKTHQMTMHRDDFICQVCKESFSTKDQLKSHYKNEHDPHVCLECGKKFSLLRYLKMHQKLHNEITIPLFKCDFCSKNFSRRSIANHVFKNHQSTFNEWRDNNLDFI